MVVVGVVWVGCLLIGGDSVVLLIFELWLGFGLQFVTWVVWLVGWVFGGVFCGVFCVCILRVTLGCVCT